MRRDLRLLLAAASSARIPLIVGSCGTSGTDSGVNWVADIVHAICAEDGLDLTVAKIFSEQHAGPLIARWSAAASMRCRPRQRAAGHGDARSGARTSSP